MVERIIKEDSLFLSTERLETSALILAKLWLTTLHNMIDTAQEEQVSIKLAKGKEEDMKKNDKRVRGMLCVKRILQQTVNTNWKNQVDLPKEEHKQMKSLLSSKEEQC